MNILSLSFPRCGANWLKYIVETIKSDCEYTKIHRLPLYQQAAVPSHDKKKIIVIVRDYKECIPRHMTVDKHRLGVVIEAMRKMRGLTATQNPLSYIHPLAVYDKWLEKNRLLIYYEDLMTGPEKQIKRIGAFVEADTSEFIDSYESHRLTSLKSYSDPQTKGEKLKFHRTIFSRKESFYIDDMFLRSEKCKQYKKYLMRYKESWIGKIAFNLGNKLLDFDKRTSLK